MSGDAGRTPGPWSAQQVEWLQALGHDVWRHAGAADHPLARAVLRAAGRDPCDPAAQALMASLPPVRTLRADPAAKRALWPRLRAMRPRRP